MWHVTRFLKLHSCVVVWSRNSRTDMHRWRVACGPPGAARGTRRTSVVAGGSCVVRPALLVVLAGPPSLLAGHVWSARRCSWYSPDPRRCWRVVCCPPGAARGTRRTPVVAGGSCVVRPALLVVLAGPPSSLAGRVWSARRCSWYSPDPRRRWRVMCGPPGAARGTRGTPSSLAGRVLSARRCSWCSPDPRRRWRVVCCLPGAARGNRRTPVAGGSCVVRPALLVVLAGPRRRWRVVCGPPGAARGTRRTPVVAGGSCVVCPALLVVLAGPPSLAGRVWSARRYSWYSPDPRRRWRVVCGPPCAARGTRRTPDVAGWSCVVRPALLVVLAGPPTLAGRVLSARRCSWYSPDPRRRWRVVCCPPGAARGTRRTPVVAGGSCVVRPALLVVLAGPPSLAGRVWSARRCSWYSPDPRRRWRVVCGPPGAARGTRRTPVVAGGRVWSARRCSWYSPDPRRRWRVMCGPPGAARGTRGTPSSLAGRVLSARRCSWCSPDPRRRWRVVCCLPGAARGTRRTPVAGGSCVVRPALLVVLAGPPSSLAGRVWSALRCSWYSPDPRRRWLVVCGPPGAARGTRRTPDAGGSCVVRPALLVVLAGPPSLAGRVGPPGAARGTRRTPVVAGWSCVVRPALLVVLAGPPSSLAGRVWSARRCSWYSPDPRRRWLVVCGPPGAARGTRRTPVVAGGSCVVCPALLVVLAGPPTSLAGRVWSVRRCSWYSPDPRRRWRIVCGPPGAARGTRRTPVVAGGSCVVRPAARGTRRTPVAGGSCVVRPALLVVLAGPPSSLAGRVWSARRCSWYSPDPRRRWLVVCGPPGAARGTRRTPVVAGGSCVVRPALLVVLAGPPSSLAGRVWSARRCSWYTQDPRRHWRVVCGPPGAARGTRRTPVAGGSCVVRPALLVVLAGPPSLAGHVWSARRCSWYSPDPRRRWPVVCCPPGAARGTRRTPVAGGSCVVRPALLVVLAGPPSLAGHVWSARRCSWYSPDPRRRWRVVCGPPGAARGTRGTPSSLAGRVWSARRCSWYSRDPVVAGGSCVVRPALLVVLAKPPSSLAGRVWSARRCSWYSPDPRRRWRVVCGPPGAARGTRQTPVVAGGSCVVRPALLVVLAGPPSLAGRVLSARRCSWYSPDPCRRWRVVCGPPGAARGTRRTPDAGGSLLRRSGCDELHCLNAAVHLPRCRRCRYIYIYLLNSQRAFRQTTFYCHVVICYSIDYTSYIPTKISVLPVFLVRHFPAGAGFMNRRSSGKLTYRL